MSICRGVFSHFLVFGLILQIRKLGGEALVIGGDMSHPDEIAALFKQTMDEWGTVDVLVNNAGESRMCLLLSLFR